MTMSILGPARSLIAVGLTLSILSCDGAPVSPSADLVLIGGNVITVDDEDRVVEAVAVLDGRIVAVGGDADIAARIGPQTRVIDLEGKTVTPGLLDAHAHFNGSGADRLFVADLSYPSVSSVRDVVRTVGDLAEERASGDWIEGRGWDEGKLEELRYVYASDLDAVSADNPVWLTHTMGHYGVANSAALALAGVTRDTPDPPGGTIDRYADGTPTGVLKESAQGLVSRLIPGYTDEQIREGMAALADAFNAEGMTGVKDPGISQSAWDSYQHVKSAGDLSVRVFALWRAAGSLESTRELIERIGPFTKPYESTGDDHVISGGVKLYIDGSGGARTAWMYEDWNRDRTETDAGNLGYPTSDPEMIREQIGLLHEAGIHVSVHSIGDRGIDWTVDSYWQALEQTPTKGLRHGIIHANIPTEHAIGRIAEMQATYDAAFPEPSPTFTWWIGDTYAGNFGPERSLRLNPLRTFEDNGIRWASGSDYSVTPFAARYGIWASVARETVLGVYGSHPFGQDESVDVRTALRSFTIWTARQMFLEDEIGSIEVGKYADLAVWDRDLYTVPTRELRDIECVMTIFNGAVVFER